MEESYYEILGLQENATIDEIKQKRKELSKKYHPDKLPEEKKKEGEIMIKKINEAYEILSDPEKRKHYDKYGKENMSNQELDPHDLINKMFKQKQKIQPIKVYVDMTLEDIFSGMKVSKTIDRLVQCLHCGCTGFEDKKAHICKNCNGQGMHIKMKQRGVMLEQIREVCKLCNGSGKDKSIKCTKCSGNSLIKEQTIVNIDIPSGVRNNDIIELIGKGHNISNNTKKGDVLVIIKELPHKIYKRGVMENEKINLANLIIEIELELHEAICGFTKSFKYLDGSDIYIDNYDIIRDGDIKVIQNKGLPYKGNIYLSGDLYVKFKVLYPISIIETNKIKLYELLTNKKYSIDDIHKHLDPDILISELKDIKDCHKENYHNDDDDNEPQYHIKQQEVNCATQ